MLDLRLGCSETLAHNETELSRRSTYVRTRTHTTHHLQPQSMFMHVAQVEHGLGDHLVGGDLVLVDGHLVVHLSPQTEVVVVTNPQPRCGVALGGEESKGSKGRAKGAEMARS